MRDATAAVCGRRFNRTRPPRVQARRCCSASSACCGTRRPARSSRRRSSGGTRSPRTREPRRSTGGRSRYRAEEDHEHTIARARDGNDDRPRRRRRDAIVHGTADRRARHSNPALRRTGSRARAGNRTSRRHDRRAPPPPRTGPRPGRDIADRLDKSPGARARRGNRRLPSPPRRRPHTRLAPARPDRLDNRPVTEDHREIPGPGISMRTCEKRLTRPPTGQAIDVGRLPQGLPCSPRRGRDRDAPTTAVGSPAPLTPGSLARLPDLPGWVANQLTGGIYQGRRPRCEVPHRQVVTRPADTPSHG